MTLKIIDEATVLPKFGWSAAIPPNMYPSTVSVVNESTSMIPSVRTGALLAGKNRAFAPK